MMATDDNTGGLHGDSAARAANREWLAAGTRLDDFEILRTIGSGGFGTVYLARDLTLDREVAIKEFLPTQLAFRANGLRVAVRAAEHEGTYAAGLRSFVNEAKILARLDHPAVVKVHRFWEANGTAYMVMPCVRGPRLRDVRRAMRSAPTEAWLRKVVDPLLDALAMLHAEGIYHRDIAPDNILLPSPHEPVLLDFGAARRIIGDRTQTLTAVLKPRYAPIEQYAEATMLRQGPWTDLYALAAVVVYMLKALPPPPSTVRAIHDEMRPLISDPPPGVSTSFLAAVQWALAVRPQDRPQSVQEFRSALDGRIAPPASRPIVRVDAASAASAHPLADHEKREDAADSFGAMRPLVIHEDAALYPHHPAGATWDTTLRMSSTTTTTLPATVRFPNKGRAASRAAVAAVVGAFALVAGTLVSMLRGIPVEADASTWRELARQAPQPDAVREVERMARTEMPARVPLPPLQDAAATLKTVAATSVPAEPAKVDAAPPPVAEVAAASLSRMQAAKPVAKRVAKPSRKAASARAKPAPVAVIGPREACSDHNFFMIGFCMSRKCEEPQFRAHAQCVAMAQEREQRSRRFGQL